MSNIFNNIYLRKGKMLLARVFNPYLCTHTFRISWLAGWSLAVYNSNNGSELDPNPH